MLKHIPFYASLLGRELADEKKANNGIVLVYGAIEVHAMGEKGCIASNTTIAKETGLSAGTVANYISLLNKSGWVKVHTATRTGKDVVRESIEPLLSITAPNPSSQDDTLHTSVIPPSSGDETPLHTSVKIEDSLENSDNTNNVEIQSIYDFFISSFNKNPNQYKLTRSRKQKISARLKDAGADMLMKAIKNTAGSEFHNGDNDRGWVADLDFIIRSYEQVERLSNINLAKKQSDGFIDINEEEGRITGGF